MAKQALEVLKRGLRRLQEQIKARKSKIEALLAEKSF
jgi:phage shock protein A